jgi:hypothetical protein
LKGQAHCNRNKEGLIMNRTHQLVSAVSLALVSGACSADSLSITEVEIDDSTPPAPTPVSWDEFQSSIQSIGDGAYLVEGDILLGSDEELRAYYDDTYAGNAGKSIIDFTSSGAINKRVGTPRPVIGYCVDSSFGTSIPCDFNGDGTIAAGDFSNPPLNPTLANLQAGMLQWERVANVDFVQRSPATCSGGAAQPADVSFRIQHYCDVASPPNGSPTGIAFGSFPDRGGPSWNLQIIGIPSGGVGSVNFAAHEVGHVLGFRHEHVHSGDASSGTFCSEDTDGDGIADSDVDNVDFDELTAFDTSSVMKYLNCATGADSLGAAGEQARRNWSAQDLRITNLLDARHHLSRGGLMIFSAQQV